MSNIEVELGGKVITDIITLHMYLDMRGALDRHEPDALQVTLRRKVGALANAEADQLLFSAMRVNDRAGANPLNAEIRFTDPQTHQLVGTWKIDQAVVTEHSVDDLGANITERGRLSANGVVYTKDGGPSTKKLEV